MNFLFSFFCLNIFIILDDNKFCNCDDDSNGMPIRLDGVSDEEAFKKGLDLYQKRERGEIAETTSGYHEDDIEEEAREKTAVIVFGVDPHINDRETIKRALFRLFKDIMQVDLKIEDLIYVVKLGVDAKYKRPTLVKLSQPHFKDQILFRRRRLRGLRYKVENYLRRGQVEKQRRLLPVMKFYRRMGKYAIIREGVLMVDGKILQNTDFLIQRLKQANAANLFTDLVSPPFVKLRFSREYSTFFPLNLTDHRFHNLYDDMIERIPTTTPGENDDDGH